MACSRILAFIFSLRASTCTRTPAALSLSRNFIRVLDVALSLMGTIATCTGESQTRERSGVVLDEHAEEALDRAVQRAVHHQRLMALAVFADVLELEALRAG